MRGARAVRSVLLDDMKVDAEQANIIAVWIDMLSTDGPEAAADSASIFEPFPDVMQFYDPDRVIGKAVAASIGAYGHTAWDMYLFYDPGSQWSQGAPRPRDWVHQLAYDKWADRDKFAWGIRLPGALRARMRALLGEGSSA